MRYYIQFRTGKTSWSLSSFAKSFETESDAWRYCATLDQDGLIPPDSRVVDASKHVCARPSAGTFQAELMGF